MRELITYIIFLPLVVVFMFYKGIEYVINTIYWIVDIKDRLHSQLNVFFIQRLVFKTVRNGYKRMII